MKISKIGDKSDMVAEAKQLGVKERFLALEYYIHEIQYLVGLRN